MDLLDYATLKVIWWVLIGVLFLGFWVMDGHDMGIGSLLPFVAKNEEEREIVTTAVDAHWEGNQTWLITLGGAFFAAIPMVYATSFSGFYFAILAVLWALFFRPVGFMYRNLMPQNGWRKMWDWGIFIGSFVPTLIFGVAFGNLLEGTPFHFDNNLRSFYTGSFWALLNPFAILCGLVSVAMTLTHGGVYLAHRTIGDVHNRCRKVVSITSILTLVLFSVAGVWVAYGIDGYVVTSQMDVNSSLNTIAKTVAIEPGAWLNNYKAHPITIIVPVLAYVGFLLTWVLMRAGRTLLSFITSSIGIFGIIWTAGVSMFPFLMPSSSDPKSSLTIWDSTASSFTLFVMLIAAIIFVPTITIYTSWCFSVMRGKVTKEYVRENAH